MTCSVAKYMSHHSGLKQRKEGVINNKVQNKDISDRIMYHSQHCHVIFTISKILWTNEWIVKALVTVSQQIKADCIHCSEILGSETFFSLSKFNDETSPIKSITIYSILRCFSSVIKSTFVINVLWLLSCLSCINSVSRVNGKSVSSTAPLKLCKYAYYCYYYYHWTGNFEDISNM